VSEGRSWAREATAAVGIPVLVWSIGWAPKQVFAVLLALALFVAAGELALLAGRDHRLLRIAPPIVAIALLLGLIDKGEASGPELLLWLVAMPIAVGLAWLWTPTAREGALTGMPVQLAAIVYVGGLGAVTLDTFLRYDGRTWITLLLVASWGGDACAYYAGRAFGRHPLASRVSPKKTWEGAIAGGLGTVVATIAVAHFTLETEGRLPILIALGLLLALLGQTGDLVESMLKRAAGVKDSGSLLPGHGGLLDRIDSVLFAAPALWLVASWWDYLP